MARLNTVSLLGTVVNEELSPRTVSSEKTDGKTNMTVLNFHVRCYDKEDGRPYTLPVAVWGDDLVSECWQHLKKDDLVYIQGELRYKHFFNKETQQFERVYTTVKAETVEFVSKKLKDKKLDEQDKVSMNQVRLIGNLVEEPIISENGEETFVVAVDRLYPSKDLKVPNFKLTDYVTLVARNETCVKSKLEKGSVAIIEGKLMTRKKNEKLTYYPRIVVDVKEMIGG